MPTSGSRFDEIKAALRHGLQLLAQASDGTGALANVAGFTADGSLTARTPFGEVPAGTQDGTNTTFTLSQTPIPGTVIVTRNGVVQDANWITITGTSIVFAAPPVPTDQIYATYLY